MTAETEPMDANAIRPTKSRANSARNLRVAAILLMLDWIGLHLLVGA